MSRRAPAVLIAAVAASAILVAPAGADVFRVDSTLDNSGEANPGDGVCATFTGRCSVRAAIDEADALPGFDTVRIPAGRYDVSAGPPLRIESDISIAGAGAAATILDKQVEAGLGSSVVVVDEGDVTVAGVTIRGGRAVFGAGIDHRGSGRLDLRGVIVRGNTAFRTDGGFAAGGGIAQRGGLLSVRDSAITANSASSTGAAGLGAAGGGLWVEAGATEVLNTTVAGNAVGGDGFTSGGGIHSEGRLTLGHVTLFGNSAEDAGGNLTLDVGTPPAEAAIVSTLIAEGLAPGAPSTANCDVIGSPNQIAFAGRNLADPNGECGLPAADLRDVDPLLGPLSDNGGPVLTVPLQGESPARNAVPAASCPAGTVAFERDARGVPRPQGGRCDIGAYELARCGGVQVELVGTGRADRLRGGAAPDGLLGLAGRDRLQGKAGRDGLCGGPGRDRLSGGRGRDALVAAGGGRDRVRCGPGRDRVRADRRDRIAPDCERVRR